MNRITFNLSEGEGTALAIDQTSTLTFAGATPQINGSGAGSIGCPVSLAADLEIVQASAHFQGGITGTGGITLTSGDMSWAGDNTVNFSGVLTLAAGTSTEFNDVDIQGTANIVNHTTFNYGVSPDTPARTMSRPISGTGNLLVNPTLVGQTGTWTLNGALNYSGSTSIGGGKLVIASPAGGDAGYADGSRAIGN